LAVHRKARAIADLAADSQQFQTEELIERYGNQWLATARRSCSNSADAEDAYQRALETLLTKPPAEDDPERIAAWVHTVVKNEALQMTRGRKRELNTEFEVIVGGLASDDAQPEESLVDSETHGFAKEALRRLRPDQTRCLLLRADGFDYPEICSLTGFSYAKVNRLLSEGRKSARLQVAAIDGGRECDRIEPLLSLLADGEADAAAEQDARMHLESCARCRQTLRDYTLAPRDLAAAMPLGVAALHSGWWDRMVEPFHRIAEFFGARASGGSGDSAIAVSKKALAVIAAGATVVGGGAAIHKATSDGNDPKTARTPAAKTTKALVTPIAVPDRRAAERRRARAAEKRAQAAREGDVVEASTKAAVDDPNLIDEAPAADAPADANQGAAADPKDTGAGDGTGGDPGGLAP
jgi:RNA polymerase sigma factor (sigma-70 family)